MADRVRFISAMATARTRSRRCRASQRTPSAISARRVVGALPSGRSTRNRPPMAATRAAAAAKVPASSRNGTAAAAANSSPPSGGATSSLATIWAPRRRPLALASCALGTTAGRIETAALSNRVSAVPRAKNTTYSSGRLAASASTATPSSPTATQRAASTRTISRRRSSRSTNAPLTSENSSQGSRWATARPATSRGSRVSEAASRGPATRVTPSPRLDTALAVHNLAKSGPRPRVRR